MYVPTHTHTVRSFNRFDMTQFRQTFTHPHSRIWFLFTIYALFTSTLLHRSLLKRKDVNSLQTPNATITTVTLAFNITTEHQYIEHNCALISATTHRYIIYTDDISLPYCAVCTCVFFQRNSCTCPKPSSPDCALCEKLKFVEDMISQRREFLFLDSDLVILQPKFLDLMYSRSREFDFLATYGFGDPCKIKYSSPFNSGLMFFRRLHNLNYSKLNELQWEMSTNNDQNVISSFVQSYYKNWDTLSLQWHCRYLHLANNNIPYDQCLTFHGRGPAMSAITNKLNNTLLKII